MKATWAALNGRASTEWVRADGVVILAKRDGRTICLIAPTLPADLDEATRFVLAFGVAKLALRGLGIEDARNVIDRLLPIKREEA